VAEAEHDDTLTCDRTTVPTRPVPVPVSTHELKCEVICVILLFALVTAAVKFWMAAWIVEI
jgi:hypothetical protein